ncbi:MAG TPA: RDD family protein [Streptosporangiaceae bacterium]|jgi:uncharacterized RDD family membrane protein YckC
MSMPQGGGSGQSWEAGSEPGSGTGPQAGASGPAGGPQGQPGYEQPGYEQQPGYGQPGQAQYGQPQSGPQPPAYSGGGAMEGRPISPVNEIETRVSGRRIVQYIVDAILSGVVFWLLSLALNRGHGGLHAVLILVLVLVNIAWYFLYWAYVPFARNGQTIGMSLLGIRVISRDGGPASLAQLFIRSILLVLFSPLSLLVGIITMMCSRYRQRVGDHIAKTMVVSARVTPSPAQAEFAGAGQAGTR